MKICRRNSQSQIHINFAEISVDSESQIDGGPATKIKTKWKREKLGEKWQNPMK